MHLASIADCERTLDAGPNFLDKNGLRWYVAHTKSNEIDTMSFDES